MRGKAESGRTWEARCRGRECARRGSWAWVAAAAVVVRPSDDYSAGGAGRASSHYRGCLPVYAQQKRLAMGKGKAKVLVIQELSLFVEKRYTFFTPTRLASEPPAFALMGALDRRWLSLLKMRAARSSFFFRSRPVDNHRYHTRLLISSRSRERIKNRFAQTTSSMAAFREVTYQHL